MISYQESYMRQCLPEFYNRKTIGLISSVFLKKLPANFRFVLCSIKVVNSTFIEAFHPGCTILRVVYQVIVCTVF